MFMMAWSLTNAERAKVRDLFLEMDKSNQGTITLGEFKSVLKDKVDMGDERLAEAFEALDVSNTEEIHYTEFLAAMVSTRIQLNDDLLKDAFQRFDVDNS